MSWMFSIWVATALLALCEGQNTVHEGNILSPSGYHLCINNETRNVSFLVMHTVPYTLTKPCGGWLAWKTCTVILYRMIHQIEFKTVMEQVTRCCSGYVQVGHYCALPVNRSDEYTAKPGSCPTADGLYPRSQDCVWDTDCPGWQKCCQRSGHFLCSYPANSSNYYENGGYRFNATVTVKTDYQELMSNDRGHLNHTRLIQAMVIGALQSDVSVYYLSSHPVHPYRIATSLLIDCNFTLSLYNVTSKLHLLLKHIQEVSSVTVYDVDECAHSALRQCSLQADCNNTVGSYYCACHQGYIDVYPSNPGAHCTAPPSITSMWSANVTGTSFCVYWSSQFQTNQTYLVVLSKRSEVIDSWVTSQTMKEMKDLQPGALYNVTVTPHSYTSQGVSFHILVKTDAQTIDATARLTNIEFTADLQNTSSQAYENLFQSFTQEIYQSLSPEVKAMVESGHVRIEITGFSPGSVVVNFTIIFVPSQSQDISNVYTVLLHSLMNSTKYTVDNTSTSDFDECVSLENDCSQWANCTNTWASYTCDCLEGYIDNNPERPGRACQAPTTTTTAPTPATTTTTTAPTTATTTTTTAPTTATTTTTTAPTTATATTTTAPTPATTTTTTAPTTATTTTTTAPTPATTTTTTAPTTATTTTTTAPTTATATTTTAPTPATTTTTTAPTTATTTTTTAPTTATTTSTTTLTTATTTPTTAATTTTNTPTTATTTSTIAPTTATTTTTTAPTTATTTSTIAPTTATTTTTTAPTTATTTTTTTPTTATTTSTIAPTTATTTTTTAPTTAIASTTTSPTTATTTTTTAPTTAIASTTTAPTTAIASTTTAPTTATTTSTSAPTTATTTTTTAPTTATTTTTAATTTTTTTPTTATTTTTTVPTTAPTTTTTALTTATTVPPTALIITPTTITTVATTTTTAPTTATTTTTTTPTTTTPTTAVTTTTTTPTTATTTTTTDPTTAPTTTTIALTTATTVPPTAPIISRTTTTTTPTTATTTTTTTPTTATTTTTTTPTTATTTTTTVPTTATTTTTTVPPTAPVISPTTTTTAPTTTTTPTATTTAWTFVTSTPTTIPTTTISAPTTNATALRNATNAISVECRLGELTVTIAKDFLLSNRIQESTLYLGLQQCGFNGMNATHVQLTVDWNECDTSLEHNTTYYTASVTLFNTMDTSLSGTVEAPRGRLEVPIKCTYMKSMVISADFGSMGYEMIKDIITGLGSFQVTVQLMNGTMPLPHNYSLSSQESVVVEVSLNTSSELIKVVINKCWATSTPNPADTVSYPFLENSCALNSYTTVLMNGNSSTSRVSVKIFAIVNLDVIYVHCQVQICVETGSVTCVPDCLRRTARSSNTIATTFGSTGPLLRSDDESLEEGYNILHIVGLSFLGIGLSLFFIIGFVCLFYYQRNRIGHYNFSVKPKQENFTYLVFNT